jgi:hypothetical protein
MIGYANERPTKVMVIYLTSCRKGAITMNKKWYASLTIPVLAAMLVTGCAADDQDPPPEDNGTEQGDLDNVTPEEDVIPGDNGGTDGTGDNGGTGDTGLDDMGDTDGTDENGGDTGNTEGGDQGADGAGTSGLRGNNNNGMGGVDRNDNSPGQIFRDRDNDR